MENIVDSDLTLDSRKELLFNADGSDVKFMFATVTESSNVETCIHAHKRILSIGSCVFDQMFNGLMAASSLSNDSHTLVHIPDIPVECFKNMLNYIYTGSVELDEDNVLVVMYAAHKYQVYKLESLCCNFLYKKMDISNVLEIYEMTKIFDNDIAKQCLQWVDDVFADITKCESFFNLKKATLMDLLKRDTLNISELNLFRSIYKWADNYCTEASMLPSDENLRKAADDFKYIRFPTMTFQEFAECNLYGANILTPEEKVDVWDAISNIRPSSRFNSTKRIRGATSFRAITFSYAPATYTENASYLFMFQVRRIVYLNSISVIRSCWFTIFEAKPGDVKNTKGRVIHVEEKSNIPYTFVPNVYYALVTVDSFKCPCLDIHHMHRCMSNNPRSFESYAEMQEYFNRISQLNYYNFTEHDPFVFAAPQKTLIKTIVYHTSK